MPLTVPAENKTIQGNEIPTRLSEGALFEVSRVWGGAGRSITWFTARVSPARTTLVLAVTALVLVIASVMGQVMEFYVVDNGHAAVRTPAWLFDLDRERNIPTVFQSLVMLTCSLLLVRTAFAEKRAGSPRIFHWAALSAVFLFVALDEMAGLHEIASHRLGLVLNAGGLFYFTWVAPGAVLVLGLALAYLRFIASLAVEVRYLFIAAGALCVAGGLGMEMVGGYYVDVSGVDMTYKMLTTVEEALEMAGIVVFLHALLSCAGGRMNAMSDHVEVPVRKS